MKALQKKICLLTDFIKKSRSCVQTPVQSVVCVAPMETFVSVRAAVAKLKPAEPLRCLLPYKLREAARCFLDKFQGQSLYAVKSNPDPDILAVLIEAGINRFDVASIEEVRLMRSLCPAARLSFMHPVKSRPSIRDAYFQYGVREFVLDSEDELNKICEETSFAKDLTLVVRLFMPKGSALCSLSGKFGILPSEAAPLLRLTAEKAAKVGISFHIGSQSMEPDSYANAIKTAGDVMRESGVTLSVLDIGGGFPIPHLGVNPPALEAFFDKIHEALAVLNLPKDCEIWAEPGRALSGTGEVLIVRVELRKGNRLYINDGSYGNMFEVCSMNWQNEVELIRDGDVPSGVQTEGFELWGPTCDSVDYMKGPFMLPSDVREGDWIALYGMGAYGAASQSKFNGFGAAQKVVIDPR